jgi:glycosyltransferase involved in cell wall biosynthesis
MKKDDFTVFYIDPQSYHNLAVYDYNLIGNMTASVHYFASKHYDYKDMPHNVKVHKLFKYNKLKSNLLKALSYLFSYIVLLFFIIIKRPDVIHIQWFRMERFDKAVISFIKLISKAKIIYTAHNFLPHNSGDKYRSVYNKLYNAVDAIIVHTDDTKIKIQNAFNVSPDCIHVIPHGLLKMEFNHENYKKMIPQFDAKYDFKDKVVFASLGEQSKYKGVDLIAKVWAETPQLAENSKCKLVIAGKFKNLDFKELESLDNVVLDNRRISDEEFYYVLSHSDAYLLTYRDISQSGALLTAMNEQVPVIVSNVGGLADPLKIAKVGWVIDDLNEENLRKLLIHIINNPQEPQNIKNDLKAWRKVHDAYNWKNISTTTQNLYQNIIL